MVVGFNHNFRYRGELFHVQTEDSGLKSPNIVTLLYRGGTILASKKTSYADILQADDLEKVVEEMMKAQHKEMLRRLKDGELDDVIRAGKPAEVKPAEVKPAEVKPAEVKPAEVKPAEVKPAEVKPALSEKERQEKILETSLDDIILSYLAGEDARDKQ